MGTSRSHTYTSCSCKEKVPANTANFLMAVSPAVLAHDVSARARDVSMGIAVFPISWIYSGPFEKLRDG